MNTIKYFPTNISAQVVKLHNKCYHLKRKVIVAYSKMVFQFISRQSIIVQNIMAIVSDVVRWDIS